MRGGAQSLFCLISVGHRAANGTPQPVL